MAENKQVVNAGGRVELHVFSDRPLSEKELAFQAAARESEFSCEDLDFDDDSVVLSVTDDGAWVLGWCFVYESELPVASAIPGN